MKTVYKYPFPIMDDFTLTLPAGALLLKADMQGHQPMLWAQVDTDRPLVAYRFFVSGTGHPLPDDLSHVATFFNEPFVWHLWEPTVQMLNRLRDH
jgi:hypothetical protein